MSSDSDSGDDNQLKQFLEAADTTLFNNSMFQEKKENDVEQTSTKLTKDAGQVFKKDLPKSQRYIFDHKENVGDDFNLPESMQKHLAKKLNEILKKHYEFCEVSTNNSVVRKTEYKNRVMLLKGDDCFVNPYEDFEYDTKGPEKKPTIKRRVIDNSVTNTIDEDTLKLVAVDGNYILSRQEVNRWAKKRERKDKVFHYKMASNGILHEKEEINEFTEIRRKNKWHEKKIKHFKKV